jgi:hypothetical protein
MQWLGLASLVIVAISLMAWLYLSISAKASIAGREIQQFQSIKNKAEQNIAALETSLANVTSSVEMAKRAKRLGFKEVSPHEFEYMIIPGYGGKSSASLAPEPYVTDLKQNVVTSEFTQSLWDWVYISYVEPALDR